MNTQPIIFELTYNAPVSVVWRAIADNQQMKHWYFDLPDFKPEVGFEFRFMGGDENKQYLHLCKVTEVIPGKKLSYRWRYDGYPGNSFVTFELFEEGNTTRLKLTHEGVETLGPDNPAFAKENFEKGWTEILGTQLKGFLEK